LRDPIANACRITGDAHGRAKFTSVRVQSGLSLIARRRRAGSFDPASRRATSIAHGPRCLR